MTVVLQQTQAYIQRDKLLALGHASVELLRDVISLKTLC